MRDDPGTSVGSHIQHGILVDTNLLLVYFVGLYDSAYGYSIITRFRYTKGTYFPGDFERLIKFLDQFKKLITTPHILTEVSNMLGHLSGEVEVACFNLFKETIPSLEEYVVSSEELSRKPEFTRFGITDTAILAAARRPCLVLTDDFRLSNYLNSSGMSAINFHQIKPLL